MTEGEPYLEAAIRRQIHQGLTVDVSISMGRELGVLFGASGAGKTSTLAMIAGLQTPDEGTIEVGGISFFDRARSLNLRLRDRQVGYVFQHDVLFPHLDVEANLRYGLKGFSPSRIEARVIEVCELCGIHPLIRRRIATLSGGERQRVGLARAIAPRPRLLLCDEPVSAIDLGARYRLLSQLKEIQRIEAIPVLLVTHAVDEALTFGDRLFLLDQGRVAAHGRPDEVLAELSSRSDLNESRLRNVFAGVVARHDLPSRSTTILLTGGPSLVVSSVDRPIGAPIFVRVDSEEIVLARGPLGPLSARNLIPGTIDRIVIHDTNAEVAVRVDDLLWMVGIIEASARSLDLKVGDEVKMIIKARSCRPLIETGNG